MNNLKEYYIRIDQDTSGNFSFFELPNDTNPELTDLFSTSGSTSNIIPTGNVSVSRIIQNLAEKYQGFESSSQKELFLSILTSFQKILLKYLSQSYEISHLPPIHVVLAEDQSVLIEWIYLYFRIGLSIEKEIESSSWYLVSNSNLENISNSGLIDPNNIDDLVDTLIAFIVKNT